LHLCDAHPHPEGEVSGLGGTASNKILLHMYVHGFDMITI
jgi:hypothetical protein